ncbi:hypothetical protein [Cognaticolwellia mytili]|uniref:hypothetical protein n=1 Tax=Cognaticolwellia mytili TaxID=1888913 RepID=UPI000A16CF00|nr:hypothetical protein [Cognaticolwellia mytili]
MDIFTTVLTRVVPVPIKPANLKVKALAKEAAANGVSDDLQGLEDHELYLNKQVNDKTEQEQQKQAKFAADETIEPTAVPSDNTGQNVDLFDDSEEKIKNDKDDEPHLDLFV